MGTLTESPSLTFAEFEELPDRPGKLELLKGDLVELPPAELNHNLIAHRIFRALDGALAAAQSRGEAQDLGEVFMEMGYRLPGNGWLQPDVSVTHRTQPRGKYFSGAPAIAVEVISASNRAAEIDLKTGLYFEAGAREVWRVYPLTRHVVIHAGTPWESRVEREALATPLLPGWSLPLSALFPE